MSFFFCDWGIVYVFEENEFFLVFLFGQVLVDSFIIGCFIGKFLIGFIDE